MLTWTSVRSVVPAECHWSLSFPMALKALSTSKETPHSAEHCHCHSSLSYTHQTAICHNLFLLIHLAWCSSINFPLPWTLVYCPLVLPRCSHTKTWTHAAHYACTANPRGAAANAFLAVCRCSGSSTSLDKSNWLYMCKSVLQSMCCRSSAFWKHCT